MFMFKELKNTISSYFPLISMFIKSVQFGFSTQNQSTIINQIKSKKVISKEIDEIWIKVYIQTEKIIFFKFRFDVSKTLSQLRFYREIKKVKIWFILLKIYDSPRIIKNLACHRYCQRDSGGYGGFSRLHYFCFLGLYTERS